MTKQELREFVFGDLGLCGCGDPGAVLERLKKLLASLKSDDMERMPEKWHRFRMILLDGRKDEDASPSFWMWLYWMGKVKLIEHGTSIRCSWLTEKGQDFLVALEEHGTDPDGWEDEPT